MKKIKPASDWKANTLIIGGYTAEIPSNAIRRYPHYPYRRKVTCSITSWVGVSIGARHTYADVEEEYNPWWDDAEKAWRKPWDLEKDTAFNGQRFHAEFIDKRGSSAIDQAQVWIRKIISTHFPSKTHKIQYSYEIRRPKWLYREGD